MEEMPKENQKRIIAEHEREGFDENHPKKNETNVSKALENGCDVPDKDCKDRNADDSGKNAEILLPPMNHTRNAVIEKTKKQQQSCVKFKVHYEAVFGESLYILGSISALGSWRIESALRMKWTEGNNWVGSVFSSDLTEQEKVALVEYKYGKAATESPCQSFVLWEDGQNRTLYLPEVSQLCVDDVWSHRKVVLRLFETKSINDLYVLGDCEEIGTYESPQRMEKVIRTNYADSSQTVFWEKTFLIQARNQRIKYVYAKKDKNQMLILDRQPRRLRIKEQFKQVKWGETTNYVCPKTYGQLTPIEINDNHFSSNFTVTQIDENIYLGPYPQSEDDIKELSNRGIKAVLNLQTDHDMSLRGANYIMILRFYKLYNIQPFHFPVVDMDVIDMCYKLQDVSKLLHFLVTTLNKVYVHCTAGMFRSPQCVIGYYTYFKNMNVSQAIQKVESQHPQSKINKNYIEMVMSSTPVQTSCSLSDIETNGTNRELKTPQRLFVGLSDSEFAQFEENENNDEEEEEDADDNYQPQSYNYVLPADSTFISAHKQHRNPQEEVDKLHSPFTCS